MYIDLCSRVFVLREGSIVERFVVFFFFSKLTVFSSSEFRIVIFLKRNLT